VTAVFAAISQRPVLIDVLERAGFDAERLLERASADAMIAQLEAETKAAAERGVFAHQQCSLEIRCTSETTALTSSSKRFVPRREEGSNG
jgi:hypothetical protein